MLRTLVRSLALLLPLVSASAQAGNALDSGYADAGQKALTTLGGYVEGIGSCPHADGSVSVIGFRASSASLVIVRLNGDGSLDRNFSGDGVNELALGAGIDAQHSAVACAGVGNSAPDDDRAMVAATVPGNFDTVVMALVDLSTGGYDAGFYLGGPGFFDIGGLLYPPVNQVHSYPRARARGVFPGPAGGWLLAGQVLDANSANPRGFIARINAGGALDAVSQPNAGGFSSIELTSARVGADGDVRVLGSGVISGTTTWGLLRLEPTQLTPVSLSASGPADIFSYRVMKGRQIGGGLLVAAGLKNDSSGFGVSPRLLIVRNDSVVDLVLPPAPNLNGVAVGPSGLDGSAAATGSVNNRAVFAMGLNSLGSSAVGYYAAVVQLGDGAGVADAVDSAYGSNGAASFRYLPQPTSCSAGAVPPQRFSNIASWGNTTLLTGSIAPDCGPGLLGAVHTARLATDGDLLFRNGHE